MTSPARADRAGQERELDQADRTSSPGSAAEDVSGASLTPNGAQPTTPAADPEASAGGPSPTEGGVNELASPSLPAVQVCVRLRPVLAWERADGQVNTALSLQEGAGGRVSLRPRDAGEEAGQSTSRTRSFKFDTVIGPEKSQNDIWDMVRMDGLVEQVVAGFHATVFAYGQTGSGKTFTMEGFAYEHQCGTSAPSAAAARPRVRPKATPPDQLGLVPRAVTALFGRVDALLAEAKAHNSDSRPSCESAVVKVSFLQIYNEKIHDLLNPVHNLARSAGDDFAGLRVRWDAGRRQFFVENLFEYECQSAEEVLQHYSSGVQNKQVASTGMNVASSRSHTILVLKLVRRKAIALAKDDATGESAPIPVREVVSRFTLVDLAGSERASASTPASASGGERVASRFHEAVTVNQSLFVLRKVISALSRQGQTGASDAQLKHVPYRESKLTSLLQHAIGGNSFLLMLACLSPADKHYEENVSTLQYASQAASIKNEPFIEIDPRDRLIQQLQAKLAAAHAYILRLTGEETLPQDLLEIQVAAAGSTHRGSTARRARSAHGSNAAVPVASSVAAAYGTNQVRRVDSKGSHGRGSHAGRTLSQPLPQRPGATDPAPGFLAEGSQPVQPRRPPPRADEDARQPRRPVASQSQEGRDLFAACDAMLSSGGYSDSSGGGSRTSGAEHLFQHSPRSGPATARDSRNGGSFKSIRPPSLPPALERDTLPRAFQRLPQISGGPPGVGSGALFTEGGSEKRPSTGGRNQPCSRPNSADTSAALTGTARSTAASTSTPTTKDDALSNGLWDAVEELKQAKAGLESRLRTAEAQNADLQGQLDVEREKLQQAADAGALAKEATAVQASPQGLALAAVEAELEAVRADGERAHAENQAIRREQAALKEQLDVFLKALELDTAAAKAGADTPRAAPPLSRTLPGEEGPDMSGLGDKIGRFHSQLILEAVGLRSEVACLKKKKWILRSVLASGGESEQRAIDEELAQLRQANAANGKSPVAKRHHKPGVALAVDDVAADAP